MNDTGHIAELDLLAAQRARLADRLRAPWWYVAGSAVALAIACTMPLASHYTIGGAGLGCGALAIAVLLGLQIAFARVSGVSLGAGTGQYPSGRAWAFGMAAVLIANSVLGTFLLDSRQPAAAIAVAVLAAVAGTVCRQGHLRGIRRDLESGRGAR